MKKINSIKTARGEISRKKILETTRLLIGKSDSNSVTLDQIAIKCKISKSSILWHFGSKEELIFEVVDTVFHSLEEAFINKYHAGSTPYEKIRYFLNDYEKFLEQHPEIPMIFFSFIFNHSIRKKMKNRIRETYKWNRQTCMEQLNISENRAVILIGMLNGIVIQANIDPKQVSTKAVFSELISVMRSVVGMDSQVKLT